MSPHLKDVQTFLLFIQHRKTPEDPDQLHVLDSILWKRGRRMKEVYIHALRYHHYGRGNRRSRVMFPISYGPFKDEDSAWEWVRRSGITSATKLMSAPARENVEVPHQHVLSMKKDRKFSVQSQPNVGD